MKYKAIIKKPNKSKNFEKKRNNVVNIYVRKKNRLFNKGDIVKLFLSKSAMIGLGKSLIHWAKEKEDVKNDVLHFYPIKPDEDLVQNLGIFIAPDSVEPIIGIDNAEVIGHIIETQKGQTLEYEIKVPAKHDEIEDFEKNDDNIALFQVLDENGKDISQECVYVEVWLSENAMLGLGTEFIRLAHNFEEGKTITIEPSTEAELKQTMGIFLTPDSCPLTIECKSFGTIDQCIEDYVQKNK